MADYLAIDLMRTKLKYAHISDCLDIYDEDELSNNRFFRNIKIIL